MKLVCKVYHNLQDTNGGTLQKKIVNLYNI